MDDWDRTHSWIVYRTRHDMRRVKIKFACSSPSAIELLAVRKCFPQFRDLVPEKLKATVSGGELDVGVISGRMVPSLMHAAREYQLHLNVVDASWINHLPFDRTTGHVWLIEDHAEGEAIAAEMIAAGVPVEDSEA
jgi:hypothetical protein